MKKLMIPLFIIGLLAFMLAACGGATTQTPAAQEPTAGATTAEEPAAEEGEAPYRVALILPGRADDVSWNQAAFEGMNWAKEQLGDIDVTVVEQVYDVADIEPALIDYAQQGYDMVIGHGFQFQEPIIKVAADYPDVDFGLGTGFKTAPNVGVYDVTL